MRITLVRVGHRESTNPSVGQPLGIMYLASYLRKYRNNRDKIKLIDMKLHNYSPDETAKNAIGNSPEIIGLSCFTPDASLLHDISKSIRRTGFKGFIIAGGPYPSSSPDDVLSDKNIDLAVIGEGEDTFLELINKIESCDSIENIYGLAFIKNGGLKYNEKRAYIEDLDLIPFPAWDLIPMEEYFKYYSNAPLGKRRYMQIFTSRGCPYRCTYCHNIFGKKFRVRSVENIIGEIKELNGRYNITEFEIMDDIFNFDIKRAEQVLDRILELPFRVRLSFPNGLRGDRIDEDFVKKLKRAGTYFVGIAIETASPRLQMMLKKNLKLERVKEAIELLNKYKIFTNGFLMFGLPSETKEEMLETFKFARTSKLNIVQAFILNPFRGTEIYNMVKGIGVNFNSWDYYTIPYHLSSIPEKEFTRTLYFEYFYFYLYRLRFLKIFFYYPRKIYLLHYFLLVIRRMFKHILNRSKSEYYST